MSDNPCCECCVAASERGELDHAVGRACPYLPCNWHQPERGV